jgi:hypothetical protein
MEVITWDKDDVEGTLSFMDNYFVVLELAKGLKEETVDFESIPTEDSINLIKSELMGEYHGILVRDKQENLIDSEMYLITWDGEACNGGRMDKIDALLLEEIAMGTFTERLVD